MSVTNRFSVIDQALIELAINNPERLESLKRHHLEFIKRIDKNLRTHYKDFDQIYLQNRESFLNFEKNLLELENIKPNSKNKVKENRQASTSISTLDQPD